MTTTKFHLATNVPAGEAHIVEVDPDDAWGNDNQDGWTYQGLAGPGFTIVAEFDTEEEATAAHSEFLDQSERWKEDHRRDEFSAVRILQADEIREVETDG